MWPRWCQKRHRAKASADARCVSPAAIRNSRAVRRLSCSSSRRSRRSACAVAPRRWSPPARQWSPANAEERGRVPLAQGGGLAALLEPLERVLADRLEHREPRLAVRPRRSRGGSCSTSDAEPVERRRVGRSSRRDPHTASAASSGPPPANTAEPREQAPLVGVEQVVAPVDRAAQRPLALRQVAGAAGQQRRGGRRAAAQHRGRREQPDPRRRELDRERQAVEPAQISATAGRVRRRQREVGCAPPSPARRTARPPRTAQQRRRAVGRRRRPAAPAAAPGTPARRETGAAPGW